MSHEPNATWTSHVQVAQMTAVQQEPALQAPPPSVVRKTPMQWFTNGCVRYVERLMPDPYLFAVILTVLVVGLIFLLVPNANAGGILDSWYQGVWGTNNIFTFAMQMVLILVSGYTLAEAPIIKRGLGWLASKPRNQVEGALLCFAVAVVASIFNWGLGLVAGALMARQVAGRLSKASFPYMVAAGYMGFMVWTNGLSSSIALANTDPASKLNVIHTLTHQTVPLSLTIFQPYSILTIVAVVVVIGLAVWRMAPATADETDPAVFADDSVSYPPRTGRLSFAERLENLWILNVLFFIACAAFFVRSGFAMNIASMVMVFTALAALLHGTPIRFIRSFATAAKTSGPLLLQYPLYGGIVGLLAYAPHTGIRPLQGVIAASIVSGATMYTLPFLNYVASVVISLFVPSGGGHWAVQGPVAVSTAMQLGQASPAYLGKISLSVASGEAVANMIQPFWLLPVLAIAKLNVRQVMGFTVAAFILGFVIFGAAALIMPFV
jgi:short-chain fatty acids transporter